MNNVTDFLDVFPGLFDGHWYLTSRCIIDTIITIIFEIIVYLLLQL